MLSFFSLVFVWSAYYLLSYDTKFAWLIFILAPFSLFIKFFAITGMYAQLFSVSLFLFGLGLYIRGWKKFSILFLALSPLAHIWWGMISLLIFSTYLALGRSFKDALPVLAIFVVGLIICREKIIGAFALDVGKDFLHILHPNVQTFENFGLIFLSIVGIVSVLKRPTYSGKTVSCWGLICSSAIPLAMFGIGESYRIWATFPFLLLATIGGDLLLNSRMGRVVFLSCLALTVSQWWIFGIL
jgi:hypothetical protein